MRDITIESTNALKECRQFSKGNMQIEVTARQSIMKLHGHPIAILDRQFNMLYLDDCGWRNNTTKERLNGVLNAFGIADSIWQVDFTWYDTYGPWQGTRVYELNK